MKVMGEVKRSASEILSIGRSMSALRRKEFQQQAIHLVRLFLLHPMAGAVDEVDLPHTRAGAFLHLLDGARRLIDAPVAASGDEGRGHVDGAAGEDFELAVRAAA